MLTYINLVSDPVKYSVPVQPAGSASQENIGFGGTTETSTLFQILLSILFQCSRGQLLKRILGLVGLQRH
jgi:hypothetical protein